MADIRQTLRGAAPAVPDLDLVALRDRAVAVRSADQRRQRRTFGGVAGVLALVMALVASPLLRGGGAPSEVAVGQGATERLRAISGLSVTDPDGATLSLADYPDTPLLVYVWAPWCGPCPGVLPDLQTVATELDDVAVVTIAIHTDLEAVRVVLDETGVDLPTILLEDLGALAPLLPSAGADPLPVATPDTVPDGAGAGATEVTAGVPSPVPSGPWVEYPPNPDVGVEGSTATEIDVLPEAVAVPITVALDADHHVVDTYLGAPGGEALRGLGSRAGAEPTDMATGPSPTATPPPLAIETPFDDESGTATAPPVPGVVASPSPCIPFDPPLIGAEGGTYEVQPGDTLSLIAQAVYGDPLAFALIAEANGMGGSTPMQVGQVLIIPPNPGAAECTPPTVGTTAADRIDDGVGSALSATAPEGWTPRPSPDPAAQEWESGNTRIRFTSIAPSTGRTPAEELQAALDAGEIVFDLPDGTPGTFRNPPDTGRVLLLLPGDRLLEIASAEPSATSIDYARSDLRDWMVALSATLA